MELSVSTMITVLSLGAGVQSSTLALMAAREEIAPPDYAIFADTQSEPQSVYAWLDWLESQLPFPLIRVSKGDLREDSLRVHVSKKSGLQYVKGGIPVFILSPSGVAPLWRKCTGDYKIDPINREIKSLLKDHGETHCREYIGISLDEIQRTRISQHSWLTLEYPLIEKRMTRGHCLEWMARNGYPIPPRSACYFCPYHSPAEWMRLKTEEPEEFDRAVQYEKELQGAISAHDQTLRGTPYLTRTGWPLDVVDFGALTNERQYTMLDECEGMCGV